MLAETRNTPPRPRDPSARTHAEMAQVRVEGSLFCGLGGTLNLLSLLLLSKTVITKLLIPAYTLQPAPYTQSQPLNLTPESKCAYHGAGLKS